MRYRTFFATVVFSNSSFNIIRTADVKTPICIVTNNINIPHNRLIRLPACTRLWRVLRDPAEIIFGAGGKAMGPQRLILRIKARLSRKSGN